MNMAWPVAVSAGIPFSVRKFRHLAQMATDYEVCPLIFLVFAMGTWSIGMEMKNTLEQLQK